ncbi:glycoside hydrolase family 172 protein [Gemmatimonadota bacterium]
MRYSVCLGMVCMLLVGCGGGGEEERSLGPWDHLLSPGEGRFQHVSSFDTTGGNRDRFEIAPGDSVVLMDLGGPGVIRRMWITVASGDPHYLRRISLKMYWDGETEPSVAVPLGDFFGNGFEKTHYTALPMGVSSGGFYSYLPMPFSRHARIVAENRTGQVVDAFYFNADLETAVKLPRTLATFHAEWRRTPRTTVQEPHRVLEARGTGHLVGVSLNAESLSGSLGFLEGDEIFTVDGEFRGQGTGTEDYFNGGWYFEDGPFAAPYHGVVLLDREKGRVAAYRWHLPDPVRFRDSIRVEVEHGHGNEEVADYATVAYWYQTEPHAPLQPLPPPADCLVLGVKVPEGAVPRDSVDLVPEEGGRAMLRVPVPRPDAYEVWIFPEDSDGRPAEPVSLGTHRVDGLVWEGRIGPELTSFSAVLPVPIRRWAMEWLVVGPFPNPQRIGTEYSSALDSVYGPEEEPDSGTVYSLADGTRLAWQPAEGDSTGYVRLNPHFDPSDWVAAYAQVFLFSPDDRDALLLLGADDAHQLWVNEGLVSTRQGRNISVADDLEVPVRLRAGWNRVLLKVADLDGGWAFHLRPADPDGVLRWSRQPGG